MKCKCSKESKLRNLVLEILNSNDVEIDQVRMQLEDVVGGEEDNGIKAAAEIISVIKKIL